MNENQQFDFLDVITLMGFFAQIENLDKDQKYEEFIKKIIIGLVQEIEKLHKENGDIINKLDQILEKLDKNE